MVVQLGLSAVSHQPLGLRRGGDRRQAQRRGQPRPGPDRRKGARRRATLRSLLFGALTITSHQPMGTAVLRTQLAHLSSAAPSRSTVATSIDSSVTVSIDSFVPVPPWRAYDAIIRDAARRYGVDAALIRSVVQAESGFNPRAVSHAGALGLMQLMPELAAELDIEDPLDPRQNIMGGTRYLRRLLDLHRGNVTLALASYNAGPTAVARYGAVPPYAETRKYVRRVRYLLARSR